MKRTLLGAAAALMAMIVALTGPAAAQSWPDRPVQLVVPWSPGGAADIIARLIADPMANELGQPIVVENRPGAGGTVGSATVARAKPDGYTILMGNVSSQGIAPAFYADTIPYDVLEDFVPITQLIQQPSVLLVHPDMEASNIDELVAWLKENPGEPYATPGVGNSPYLTFEMIKDAYQVEMTNVPFNSGGEVNNALAAGQVKIAINNMPESMQAISNGIAKPIAITSPERNDLLPDVPTFKESGKDIVAISWQGLFAPAGTPEDIVTKIQAAALASLSDEKVAERNAGLGSVPVGSSPEEFRSFVESELKLWARLVEISGAKAPK